MAILSLEIQLKAGLQEHREGSRPAKVVICLRCCGMVAGSGAGHSTFSHGPKGGEMRAKGLTHALKSPESQRQMSYSGTPLSSR